MKTLVIIVSVLLMVSGLGCMALSSYITPAELDPDAIRYVVDSGVRGDDYYTGYQNLDKANKLVDDVDNAHENVQFTLQQELAKDDLDYSNYRGMVVSNRQMAVKREELLFGETGLLSMGLSMLGAGGFAGLLGLMRKRPGDVTPAEMEQALATATGKTTEELSAKQKQLIQLVQGIQQYMNTYPDSKKDFKAVLTATQDTDTQIAVSSVKAELNL